MTAVETRQLCKRFGAVSAVVSLDLEVAEGELLAIVGPSGSGKSTLLRLLAGLESPTSGQLWLGGEEATSWAPAARDAALVFQEPVLYPQLSVFENLACSARLHRRPRSAWKAWRQGRSAGESDVGSRRTDEALLVRQVREVAAVLALEEVLDRRPGQLSGGQQRRLALGRAWVRAPRLLLLDEPLAGLDVPLRRELRRAIVAWQRSTGTTTFYCTHDQSEALAVGDRVAVFRQGTLEQLDRPNAIYERPVNCFVAGFVGDPPMNLWRCEPSGDGCWQLAGGREDVRPRGVCDGLAGDVRVRGALVVGVRPERVEVRPAGGAAGIWTATAVEMERSSDSWWVRFRCEPGAGENGWGRCPGPTPGVLPGEQCEVSWDWSAVHWFAAPDGARVG